MTITGNIVMPNSNLWLEMCVCVCVCVRACACACARAMVYSLAPPGSYRRIMVKYVIPGWDKNVALYRKSKVQNEFSL